MIAHLLPSLVAREATSRQSEAGVERGHPLDWSLHPHELNAVDALTTMVCCSTRPKPARLAVLGQSRHSGEQTDMRIQAPARQPEEKRPAKAGGKGYSARSRAGGGPQGMGRRGGRKKLLSNYAGPPRRPRH